MREDFKGDFFRKYRAKALRHRGAKGILKEKKFTTELHGEGKKTAVRH